MSVAGLRENAILNTLALEDNRLFDKRMTYIFQYFLRCKNFGDNMIMLVLLAHHFWNKEVF